jgi:hypothetical protein
LLGYCERRIVIRMRTYRYPTVEEIRALENAARRARSDEIRRLVGAGVALVRRLVRARWSPAKKGLRHA